MRNRFGVLRTTVVALCCSATWAQGQGGLAQLEEQYETALAAERWAEALAHAQAAVDLLRTQSSSPGSNPAELVKALVRLGSTQTSLNDWRGAEASYEEALQLARESSPSDALVGETVRGLAKTLAAQRKYEAAVPLLQEALEGGSRAPDAYDIEQAELLRLLAESNTALRQYEAAEQALDQYVGVHIREYGELSPQAISARTVFADWYVYVGELAQARGILRSDIQRAQARFGLTSPQLLDPLRALARTYVPELMYGSQIVGALPDKRDEEATSVAGEESGRRTSYGSPKFVSDVRSSPVEGERALLRALAIAESHPKLGRTVELLLELGDWFVYRRDSDEAIKYYKRALETPRQADPDSPDAQLAARVLNYPANIYFPPVKLEAPSATEKDPNAARFVEIEYSVLPSGATADARVAQGDATGRERAAALTAVRAALYRPRFEKGEPVRTDRLRYRHVFR